MSKRFDELRGVQDSMWETLCTVLVDPNAPPLMFIVRIRGFRFGFMPGVQGLKML